MGVDNKTIGMYINPGEQEMHLIELLSKGSEHGNFTAATIFRLIRAAYEIYKIQKKGIFEDICDILPNDSAPKPENVSAASWFFWHILGEKKRARAEKRDVDETLAGGAGTWFFTEKVRGHEFADGKDQVAQVTGLVTDTVFGLTAAKDENTKKLHEYFLAAQKKNLLPQDLRFEDRITNNDWLSLVTQSGEKEWGIALPTTSEKLIARTESESNTVMVIINDARGIRYSPISLTYPDGGRKQSEAIEKEVRIAYESGGTGEPPKDTYPLFEIEIVDSQLAGKPPLKDRLQLHRTAQKGSVAREVYYITPITDSDLTLSELQTKRDMPDYKKGVKKLSHVYHVFNHITANENHGRKVKNLVAHFRPRLNTVFDTELMDKPQIISAKGSEDGYRLAEMAGALRFSSGELALFELLRERTRIGFATLSSIVQSMLKEQTTYICADPAVRQDEDGFLRKGELQISLATNTPGKDINTDFKALSAMLNTLFIEPKNGNFDGQRFAESEAVKLQLAELQKEFQLMFAATKADIGRSKKAKGFLATTETYVSQFMQNSLGLAFRTAQKTIARGNSQTSSVGEEIPDPITFVSAGSLDSTNSLGFNGGRNPNPLPSNEWKMYTHRLRKSAFDSDQPITEDLMREEMNDQLTRFRNAMNEMTFFLLMASAKTDAEKELIAKTYETVFLVVKSDKIKNEMFKTALKMGAEELIRKLPSSPPPPRSGR